MAVHDAFHSLCLQAAKIMEAKNCLQDFLWRFVGKPVAPRPGMAGQLFRYRA